MGTLLFQKLRNAQNTIPWTKKPTSKKKNSLGFNSFIQIPILKLYVHSLNNHWLNFGSSSSHDHAEQAIYSHTANTPEELSFDVGDTITDVGFKQNGYVFGILIRNNRSGFYPSYKTNQVIESYSFPTYSDVTSQNVQYLTPNERSTRKSTQSFGKLEYFLASFRN